MARKLGLGKVASRGDIDIVDATLIPDHGDVVKSKSCRLYGGAWSDTG